ncbi:MAG TPA: hypothetical protein VGC08_13645 [Pedobacter sp.]
MNENVNKPGDTYKVLGFNLLAFVIYTVIGVASGDSGLLGAFIISLVHFGVCVIMAIALRKWVWFLSGLLILIIGFGTCVSNIHLGGMH